MQGPDNSNKSVFNCPRIMAEYLKSAIDNRVIIAQVRSQLGVRKSCGLTKLETDEWTGQPVKFKTAEWAELDGDIVVSVPDGSTDLTSRST